MTYKSIALAIALGTDDRLAAFVGDGEGEVLRAEDGEGEVPHVRLDLSIVEVGISEALLTSKGHQMLLILKANVSVHSWCRGVRLGLRLVCGGDIMRDDLITRLVLSMISTWSFCDVLTQLQNGL